MKDPEDEVMKKFQIKKLPALFVMTLDEEHNKTSTH
jgi:hypothetical protein